MTETYNGFSGADMGLYQSGVRVGTLDGITYSYERDKAPIYTMGDATPPPKPSKIIGTVIIHEIDLTKVKSNIFDIRIVAANENGTKSEMFIYDCKFLDTNGPIEAKDIVMQDEQNTFAGEAIRRWRPIKEEK